ncbi:MAG: tRNA threonylcarbamoyladenosine dehydratase [Clostridia bacterium]|nr:tRNA threonylcarbamoyladenosine dehydratase [Clostridia bacterium]
MMQELSRTKMLFGEENVEKLINKKVIVFGVGGVGGYVCESLARSGIGQIDIVDNDTVSLSNINRQIIALHSTVGKSKVEVMRERMLDINPSIKVETYNTFFLPENSCEFDFSKYDYVIDAIDTVKGKVELAVICDSLNIPIIASMGAGNKIDPLGFKVADIYKTSVCPLARVMRAELKKRGVKKLKTVYSEEKPYKQAANERERIPASCSFIPSVVGLIISAEVIKDLMK